MAQKKWYEALQYLTLVIVAWVAGVVAIYVLSFLDGLLRPGSSK